MKIKVLFFYLIMTVLCFGSQIITDGQVSFYFNEQTKGIENIKSNQLGKVDIIALDIGLISNGKYYHLNEYYNSVNYNESNSKIDIYGLFQKQDFHIKIELSNEKGKQLKITSKIQSKTLYKIAYKIIFFNANGRVEQVDKNIIYNKKIQFSDTKNNGKMVLAEEHELISKPFKFKMLEREQKLIGNKTPIYIMDFGREEESFIINFGVDKREIERESSDYQRVEKKYERTKVEEKIVEQLKLMLSRAVIVDSFTDNFALRDYDIELDLRIQGYKKGVAALSDIIPKKNPTILEELIYNYKVYRLVVESPRLINYEPYLRLKIDSFIEKKYNEVLKNGVLKEYYILIKTMELLKDSNSVNYSAQINEMKNIIKRDFYLEEGLKTTNKALIANRKNMIYMDILEKNQIESIVKKEKENYYDRTFGLYIDLSSKIVDIEYNFNMVRLLRKLGEIAESDLLFARIESLIEDNGYYIPRYYRINGINKKEIYGNMIREYLILKEERKG